MPSRCTSQAIVASQSIAVAATPAGSTAGRARIARARPPAATRAARTPTTTRRAAARPRSPRSRIPVPGSPRVASSGTSSAAGNTTRPQTSMTSHRAKRSAPDAMAAASSSTSTGRVNAETPIRNSRDAAPSSRPAATVRIAVARRHGQRRPRHPEAQHRTHEHEDRARGEERGQHPDDHDRVHRVTRYGAPPPERRRPAWT